MWREEAINLNATGRGGWVGDHSPIAAISQHYAFHF